MSLPYVFHALAATELDEAVEWHEATRQGEGLALLTAARRAVRHICTFPEAAPIARGSIRSKAVLPTKRWPYTIQYRIAAEGIRVLAFSHQKRQPFYWLGRQ